MTDPRESAFLIALYRWSLTQWEAEIVEDFRLLRKVQGVAAQRALDFLAALKRDECRPLARALTKRFHPEAVALLGDSLRSEEAQALERWDFFHRRAAGDMPPRASSAVSRSLVAKTLKAGLSELGERHSLGRGAGWFYAVKNRGWTVKTFIDAGGRFQDVTYSHDVCRGDGTQAVRLLSLLSWLGISSSTRFKILHERDVPRAAAVIKELSQHFLAAFPGMVAN